MANLFTIFTLLRDEVETRLLNLEPFVYPQKRFVVRSIPDRDGKAITECTGRERLSELIFRPITPANRIWTGSQNRGYDMTLPLVITYPDLSNWRAAAISDADQIIHDLNTNGAVIPGLHIREISTAQPKEFTPHGSDPWVYMTLPLLVVAESDQ